MFIRMQTSNKRVDKRMAQIASSLKSTDFAKAVNSVKAANSADSVPQSSQAARETFNRGHIPRDTHQEKNVR